MVQNINQNINLIPNEPELKDLLDYFKKQIKLEFNCHHIGSIETFNPLTQTAQVSINYTKTFSQLDLIGDQTTVTSNYPLLIDCPVICLGGGEGSLTFPIEPGDECLVLFNDRDLDNWYGGSSSAPPATGRLHAFTDAVVLVGVRSLANSLENYSTSAVTLQFGENTIQVFNNKVLVSLGIVPTATLELDITGKLKITNAVGEFVSALNQLFTDIQNATTTTMLGPQPLIMPTFITDLAVFQSFKA